MAGPVGNDLQHYHPYLLIAWNYAGPLYAESFDDLGEVNQRREDLVSSPEVVSATVFTGKLDDAGLPFYSDPDGIFAESEPGRPEVDQ